MAIHHLKRRLCRQIMETQRRQQAKHDLGCPLRDGGEGFVLARLILRHRVQATSHAHQAPAGDHSRQFATGQPRMDELP